MLAAARLALDEAGIPDERISTVARHGEPAETLVDIAIELDAGLIVVGRGGPQPTHITQRLSHRAPCDVLIVTDRRAGRPKGHRRIVIATDGSATADRAARRGYAVARTLDAAVDLVFVGHPATGELIANDTIAVYGDDVATTVHLLVGDPGRGILETVHTVDADLVVVGNKGLTGARGLLLASVPRSVLDAAPCDVLVSRTVRQVVSELQPGEGGVIERHGERLAAYVDGNGTAHLMSARCTHLGCTVEWNAADHTFDCPCHGSRFGPSGEVVNGPAGRPLPPA